MSKQDPLFTPWDEPSNTKSMVLWEKKHNKRWRKYLLLLAAIYIGIACALGYYWSTPKLYTSQFSLMLPATGNSSKINLEQVGEAQSATTSPYAIQSVNPAVNYKQILLSSVVMSATVNKLEIEAQALKTPKIKLIDRSSIIQVKIKGTSSVDSNKRAWALYQSFTSQLDQLRNDELQKKAQSVKISLNAYTTSLNESKENLVNFKRSTALISHQQYDSWGESVETMNQQINSLMADRDDIQGYIDQLSLSLGISPNHAVDAFTLQADELFQLYQKDYQQSEADLATYISKWGNNHPAVVNEKEKRRVALDHVLNRSLELVGLDNLNTLKLINLGKSRLKSGMFEKLILSFAELNGLNQKISSLSNSREELTSKLNMYSGHVAMLDDLERELKLAEAIYASAAARLDLNKADVYGSYPLVQILSEPSYPTAPSSPNKVISLIGAILAAILATFSLTMLWYRKRLLHKVLANL